MNFLFYHSLNDVQSSYGKPLSRVAARLGDPSGLYGSLGGAGATSEGCLCIIIETVTL